MSGVKSLIAAAMSAMLAGCWTVHEAEMPPSAPTKLPSGKEVRVQLAGFDAKVTTYVPVYRHSTVSDFGGWYGRPGRRRGFDGMRTAMVSSTDFLPRTDATSAYRDLATDLLESAGCILRSPDPQYRVEVRFSGPLRDEGYEWTVLAWAVGTLFTADYGGQAWRAKLKIYETKSGRLVHEREHSRRDEAVVWGPVPFFSPLGSERTAETFMQHRCLASLTEAVAADALRFFAGNP